MTNRRMFMRAAGASAAMMPFISHLAQANEKADFSAQQAYFVRDQRFQASLIAAETARPDGTQILDVNEDVSGAYLELTKISSNSQIAAIAGVTAYTAKDIFSTLFLPPQYKLTFEHAVEEQRETGVVKLWAWRYERLPSSSAQA
ncbi:MAG: hypothetical protein AAF221_11495 [Pseudomonadota bacterium]